MSKQEEIFALRARGCSKVEIAQKLSINRKTVNRYLNLDDFSPKPPIKVPRPSKLDPYKPIIDEWLEGDKSVFHKQKHTATRVHERLCEECGFDGGITIVTDYVRKKRGRGKERSSLDLKWDPGYGQVDFGDVDVFLSGEKVRGHELAVSFPYSNMGYVQFFLGESAECVCQGLEDVFERIGGVPHTLIFDNATGVGKKICDGIMETELFSRFRMHYRFALRFCNQDAGNEKGNVERKVGFLRSSKLFVPAPTFDDIDVFNRELLDKCSFQEDKLHYKKEKRQGELFEKDAARFISLPTKAFDVCRYEEHISNGYGHVTLDKRHTYSTHPSNVRKKTICGIRATRIDFISEEGEIFSSHRRVFGNKKTESIDPSGQLQLLSRRPGGWTNSRVRADISPSVVSYLDTLEKPELKHSLKLLYEASERSGLEATLEALEQIVSQKDSIPNFFDVGVLAARIADFGLETSPVPGADLSPYDHYFLEGDMQYALN